MTLIDMWGNKQRLTIPRQMARTKHSKVLEVLEKRARRYREKAGYRSTPERADGYDAIDETGTVPTAGLKDEESAEEEAERADLSVEQREILEAGGVDAEVLQVHGSAPGSKQEGVCRLVYENLNGINSRLRIGGFRASPARSVPTGTVVCLCGQGETDFRFGGFAAVLVSSEGGEGGSG